MFRKMEVTGSSRT